MASDLHEPLTAKSAVNAAFAVFREFFEDSPAQYILLEGVEFDESSDQWRITIGFDIGRQRVSGSVFDTGKEPVREKRTIHIDAGSGQFVRMT